VSHRAAESNAAGVSEPEVRGSDVAGALIASDVMVRVNLQRQLDLLEVRYITAALRATKGNKRLAAKRLTISRSALYRRIRALGLDAEPSA
jgi:DNA-binding NtrC family response regulator